MRWSPLLLATLAGLEAAHAHQAHEGPQMNIVFPRRGPEELRKRRAAYEPWNPPSVPMKPRADPGPLEARQTAAATAAGPTQITAPLPSGIVQGDNSECGPGVGACAPGYCCSASGWCGQGPDYCTSPDCQISYGPNCDGNLRPNGPDTSNDPRPKLGNVPYNGIGIYNCVNEGDLAVTYDDGPYIYTAAMLDAFKAHGAVATWFITGNNIGKGMINVNYRDVITRMIAEGHQVASHTWSHENLDQMTLEQRFNQMLYNEIAFADILGFYPTYMRPPYSICGTECQGQLSDLGYHLTFFDLDTQGYLHTDPTQIQFSINLWDAAMLANSPCNSSILHIEHDIHQQIATTFTNHMLDSIVANGWRAVTVGECLGDPPENWYRRANPGYNFNITAVSPIACSSTASSTTLSSSSGTSSTQTSASPTSTGLIISTAGQCGGNSGQTCQGSVFGNCCSVNGWCGSGAAYCGTGCQSKFGTCGSNGQSSSTSGRTSSSTGSGTASGSSTRSGSASSSRASASGSSSGSSNGAGTRSGTSSSRTSTSRSVTAATGTGSTSARSSSTGSASARSSSLTRTSSGTTSLSGTGIPSSATGTSISGSGTRSGSASASGSATRLASGSASASGSATGSSTAALPSTTLPISQNGECGSGNGRSCLGSGFGNCCSPYNYCGTTDAHCGTGCQSAFGICGNSNSPSSSGSASAASGSASGTASAPAGRSSPSGTAALPSSSLPASDNGQCGTNGRSCIGYSGGSCCSQWNYCGVTDAHCGTGCQLLFGTCGSSSSPASSGGVSASVPPTTAASGNSPSRTSGNPALASNTNPSTSGTCGGTQGFNCLGTNYGDCCSPYGYCGNTTAHCDAGCQSGFGRCSGTGVNLAVSLDGKCGNQGTNGNESCQGSSFGNCCSAYGYCGSSTLHCGTGCQSQYGTCGMSPEV